MRLRQSQSMKRVCSAINRKGFSLVEVVLATSIFVLLAAALTGNIMYGQESSVLAGSRTRAVFLAEEGLEAVRNIRDADFANLVDGTYGLATSSNEWSFSGSSDIRGIYTRSITISSVDGDTKNISSQVTWQQNPQRTGTVVLDTYLTNWQETVVPADPNAACTSYCNDQGRTLGTCRQNSKQCSKSGEVYIPGGDSTCTAGPGADTCCCSPF
ncbi:hypothetical protein C0580_03520 [Candidatus Parcubacteria bacterium]|nr:MAG: hypothetical protein C0580_03520 [Candidatus Parcubacteria bacterium]